MKLIRFALLGFIFKLIVTSALAASFTCHDILSNLIESPHLENTWGIEMELRTEIFNQKHTANELQKYFESLGLKPKVKALDIYHRGSITGENYRKSTFSDYFVTYVKDGKEYTWTVPFEPDFYHPNRGYNYPGVEITTPILRTKEDHEFFEGVLKHLEKLGFEAAREKGGTHVHWGTGDISVRQLLQIYTAYEEAFPQIERIFRPDEGRGYISYRELSDTLLQISLIKDQDQLVKDLESPYTVFRNGPIRYNPRLGTFETRLFNSSVDAEEILFYTAFSRRLYLLAIEDPLFVDNIHKFTSLEILEALDLKDVPKHLIKHLKQRGEE